jgi:FkbM family methyltransferase
MKKILEKILRIVNFKGKGRLVKIIFPNPIRRVIPYKKSLIFIDTSQMIGWCIYWLGGYENEISWLLPHFVKQDSVCVDVGANIGAYTILMASQSKKVISIEPHPDFRSELIDNISINRFDNVEVVACAVSRRSGGATLYGPNHGESNKTATMKNLMAVQPQNSVEIEVQMRSLDSICENCERVDFIKIDCDWYDADVILSGKNTIIKHRPTLLFEDLGSFPDAWDKSGDVDQEYLDAYFFLSSIGYKIYKVKDHYLIDEGRSHGEIQNMLAIP